jgi:hypothetical protein
MTKQTVIVLWSPSEDIDATKNQSKIIHSEVVETARPIGQRQLSEKLFSLRRKHSKEWKEKYGEGSVSIAIQFDTMYL